MSRNSIQSELSSRLWAARWFFVSVVCCLVARVLVAFWWPAALALLQMIVFVVVSVFLIGWAVRAQRWLLPQWMVFGALACLLISAVGSYSLLRGGANVTERSSPVFISRLEGDPNGAAARVLREAIDEGAKVVGHQGRLARQVYRGVGSSADLTELFDQVDGEVAVVWGSQQLVRYSPVPKPGRSLGSFLTAGAVELQSNSVNRGGSARFLSGRLGDLQLVTDVSTVALSFEPARGTGEFLATLGSVAGISARLASTGPDSPSAAELRRASQILLEGAARLPFKWRSIEHRAYPFFLLGTDLVAEFLQTGMVQRALLECAVRDFRSARVNLVRGGNPELLAAVRNNAAIAAALLREIDGEPWTAELRKELGAALQLAKRPDPFGVGSKKVARILGANLAALKGDERRSDRQRSRHESGGQGASK